MSALTYEDVRAFVMSYLTKRLEEQGRELSLHLEDNCDLLLSGLLDSLGILELASAIDEYCGREINFEALNPEEMTIVGPLCRFVSDQSAQQ